MSSFLFDEMFRLGDTKVTLIRPILRQPFDFTVTSKQMVHYAIHFLGRALLCPGEEYCPVCGTIARRNLSLLIGGTDNHLGLLEVGAATLSGVDAEIRRNSLLSILGSRWQFCRMVAKRPLQVSFKGVLPADQIREVSSEMALRAFAKLFQLPRPDAGMSTAMFAEVTRPTLIAKLKAAVVL